MQRAAPTLPALFWDIPMNPGEELADGIEQIRTEVTREHERQLALAHQAQQALEQGGENPSVVSAVKNKVKYAGQLAKATLPGAVNERVIRERHIKHVTVNMGHLTDPAFLAGGPTHAVASADVSWVVNEHGSTQRPPLPPGLDATALSDEQRAAVAAWLAEFAYDADEELDARMDNQDDEVGRVQAALRARLRLHKNANPKNLSANTGTRVAFDARALQTPAFGTRGIGRFAKALLDGVRQAAGDEAITVVIDRGLNPLPRALIGDCAVATRIEPEQVADFGALVQPSPMTHAPDPLIPLLHADIYKAAVVFDFIPLHFPSIYLQYAAPRAEYATNLDALAHYTEYFAISNLVADELTSVLAGFHRTADINVQVAWPRDVLPAEPNDSFDRSVQADGPIVLMTGDDARKNTFGGLAGIAAATSDQLDRDVVVIGMAGQGTRVHHWSIAAAMRPGEATTAERISDTELAELLAAASCVVVPSFDEGLSLPVIEALRAGVPVVASDIPAHRELIGSGAFLCDPTSPRSISRAVREVRGKSEIRDVQSQRLAAHRHVALEDAIATSIALHLPNHPPRDETAEHTKAKPQARDQEQARTKPPQHRLSVGIATPWPPQRSGVADFSRAVFTELADLADVTIYTTRDGLVDEHSGLTQRPISEVFDDPRGAHDRHDVFICVVGNSHYHLLPVQLLQYVDAIALAHDTRMVEFYMALRGKGGAERVMSILPPGVERPVTNLTLDDQIDDMRLLTNAGLWEVANRAQQVLVHSPSAAPSLATQTGADIRVLPFANYRAPARPHIGAADRAAARTRLGLEAYPPDTIHLGTFGYVDVRTKMTDIVVESAAWLAQWGHSVALHLVGSAKPAEAEQLRDQAQRFGLEHFQITGFISEEQYRDWVLAVDLGVQLRISPLLGVSGPLSDFAAYGTRAVASNGLCIDVDTPAFIHRLPDAVSPVMVAEAIEQMMNTPMSEEEREQQRLAYLEEKSPRRYAQELLNILEQAR